MHGESTLDDDNTHVQQLRKLFLECDVEGRRQLNANGLFHLCEKLNLSDFSGEITRRTLAGSEYVDFHNFKERFVALLPEIIDVSSGNVDPLILRALQICRRLGFNDGQRLSRYDARLICEKTSELEDLSSSDINALFDRADVHTTGRISIHQFVNQYRLQKRLSAELHFIADTFVTSLNLFEAVDPTNTGNVDSQDLLEYWNKGGIRIDEGIAVLQQCGQPVSGIVNAIILSAFLERELSVTASEAPVAVKTAIVALHCCIDNLRCNLKELEERAENTHKQLQMANQRRTMLIEELEHNQIAIEQSYEERIRESEEKFRAKISQMEEKFRGEKREMQTDIEQVEEELSRVRQLETSSRNKVALLDRQCLRMNEELRESSENVAQLEQLNRQLRTELNKAMQARPVNADADVNNLLLWKQKVEILVNHNKRLREKVQEMSASEAKRRRVSDDLQPLTAHWSSAFRTQMNLIRKRRMTRGETLSEMDSEPEGIYFRIRRRRLQKRRDRKSRYEELMDRRGDLSRASSESESGENALKRRFSSQPRSFSVGVRQASSSPLQTPSGFGVFIAHAVEEERKRWQEECRKESEKHKQEVADALKEQETKLLSRFEQERKVLNVRMAEERNSMERDFAEEKMKLMSRLQEDFDMEVKRLTTATRIDKNSATVEHFKRQIKMLESSLEGQRNGYERRLAEMKDRHSNALRQARDHANSQSLVVDGRGNASFLSLVEKYRRHEISPCSSSPSPSSSLNVEKRPPPPIAYHHIRSTSSMSPQCMNTSTTSSCSRCEKCEQVDNRLRELYHILVGDQTSGESGIEDLGSSTGGSHIDDKLLLKKELRKWKGRFEAAKERVTELRVLVASPTALGRQYKCALGGSEGSSDWKKPPTKWSDMARHVERLESEKVILESRLSESQMMIKNMVDQYKKQLEYYSTSRSVSSQSLPTPPSFPSPADIEATTIREPSSAR